MARVDLTSSAEKDLSKLLKTPAGAAIKRVILEELATEPLPDNLDLASLEEWGPGCGSASASFASCCAR